ncbi:hypothetical protein QFZ27_007628 [Inquilinus ginsengisoli]|uniref:hypothetical protein n=1 Tax=Inquilinus ginsengisoli TaxID=363840 RepID=UPI003D246366
MPFSMAGPARCRRAMLSACRATASSSAAPVSPGCLRRSRFPARDAWESEDLFRKLSALNGDGLPFQYQPQQWEAPDALMAWWQETGRLTVSFRAISWVGPDRWLITTVEPPVIGVLGWTGPTPFDH